jgi:DNA (cytosine-5)-methyltransferase 1
MATVSIKYILAHGPAPSRSTEWTKASFRPVQNMPHSLKGITGNLDNAALHPDNQTQTVVTSRIAKLADGYFKEKLRVVGKQPPPLTQESVAAANKAARLHLWELLLESRKTKKVSPLNKKVFSSSQGDVFFGAVRLNGKTFKVCAFT